MLSAKSLSRVPRSSIALMLSSSLRQARITGLPVDEKLDLIREVAVLAADLAGLFPEFDVLGVARYGVGAALSGVCGSDGAGLFPSSLISESPSA